MMQQVKLHSQGPGLSRIIAGTWRWAHVSSAQLSTLVYAALENGITTFDHADIYGNYCCEENFGQVLRGNSALRNKLQLVTKFGIKLLSDKRPAHLIKHYDTSAEHVVWSVENSLRALNTDRIDVLLVHRPDPLLNPTEVAEAFTTLRQQGKILHAGVSNFTPTQFEMLQSYLTFPLVTNQIELSLFRHEPFFNGDTDMLMKHKVRPMAWSPLGGGKFFEAEKVKSLLERLSLEYSITPTQLLLGWLLKHASGVLPILGTTKAERMAEGAAAAEVTLDRQHWFELLKAVSGKDVA
ncbi:MAG TPA: aldo/keto reductase [Cyclobacteriaceae bacterium]|nr:aldo/keto reductase [Cyclobacteriaceae bacterium]